MRAILSAPGIRDQVIAGEASSLIFLPLSHVLARIVSLCLVREGKRVGFLASPNELAGAVGAFRPTVLLVVPRVLEKVADAARQRAAREGRGWFFGAAEATAIAWIRAAGSHVGAGLRLRHAVYDRLVYARLRDALDGQLEWLIPGGAPLGEDLTRFLTGAGITVMEGWGLTETAGPVTMNPPGAQRIGSVGLPLPGCAVRVTENDEVEMQGPSVFSGYWQDLRSSAEAFDGGWLRTGDLGRLDDDGYLYLTGL